MRSTLRIDPDRPGSVAVAAVVLGAVAGLVAALFLTIAAEPSIEEAIRLEQAAHAVDGGHAGSQADEEVVSRQVQRGAGLFGAYALTGVGFGLLFATAFVALRRGRPDPFRRSLVAGAVLAGIFTFSPWLKYPPNPPAVGDPATLGQRQALYLGLLLLTAVVAVAAVRLSGRLRRAGWDDARRVGAVVAAVALPLLVAYGVLPGAPDRVEVPATLVWRFRLASLGGNLALWTVLTLGFALVTSRRPVTAPVAGPAPAVA